jgi:hypothetical protein
MPGTVPRRWPTQAFRERDATVMPCIVNGRFPPESPNGLQRNHRTVSSGIGERIAAEYAALRQKGEVFLCSKRVLVRKAVPATWRP